LIKRVLALPGEKLKLADGQLQVLNLQNNRINTFGNEDIGVRGSKYLSEGNTALGENELFVIGDNLKQSIDSRDFGQINYTSVVGKASFVFWPPRSFGRINKLL
ncbi:signal peptidase I, partial [candidate division WWE3 bacterium]|nr:signal peptidase I [candidate division WWE3 bacterium]